MFEGKKVDSIRGLAALYPETIQFVTTADSGIKNISDLRGKKVAVGASGSGVEANAVRFWQHMVLLTMTSSHSICLSAKRRMH